jgi:hypothetical protein
MLKTLVAFEFKDFSPPPPALAGRHKKISEYYRWQEKLLEGFNEVESFVELGISPGSLTEVYCFCPFPFLCFSFFPFCFSIPQIKYERL